MHFKNTENCFHFQPSKSAFLKQFSQFSDIFSGQEEIRNPDGSLQISFPDGSIKKINADGAEDMSFPDGTKVEVKTNGDRTLYLANGQKEVHTSEFKVC